MGPVNHDKLVKIRLESWSLMQNTDPKRHKALFIITQLNYCFPGLSQIKYSHIMCNHLRSGIQFRQFFIGSSTASCCYVPCGGLGTLLRAGLLTDVELISEFVRGGGGGG